MEIIKTTEDAEIGQFSFRFVSLHVYDNLLLYVEIYVHDGAIWEYRPIPGSPFNINVLQLNIDYYCLLLDLLYAGFGYTYNSIIS